MTLCMSQQYPSLLWKVGLACVKEVLSHVQVWAIATLHKNTPPPFGGGVLVWLGVG